MAFPPLKFKKNTLYLIDQRQLPARETWIACKDAKRVHWAIREMVVRGAPAIGVAAGYGLYLGIAGEDGTRDAFFKRMHAQAEYLKGARPTGVNLRNVIDRIVRHIERAPLQEGAAKLRRRVYTEAVKVHREDDRLCRAIGRHGARLFGGHDRILTHCNAGGLATTGYGTALGVIYAAKSAGKKISVFVDETRPLLQGARLTAWELTKSKIPCQLICDNAAASLMQEGRVDRVVVGADRIAANGDTANKIGTYNLAVLANVHNIPFYIAAPSTTFDFSIRSGKEIPIEDRKPGEVTEGFGRRTAPRKMAVLNRAFDVTPFELITAFVTEAGVLKPPFKESFKKLKKS